MHAHAHHQAFSGLETKRATDREAEVDPRFATCTQPSTVRDVAHLCHPKNSFVDSKNCVIERNGGTRRP